MDEKVDALATAIQAVIDKDAAMAASGLLAADDTA